MNRRNFIQSVVSGLFILPSATTYARIWKPTEAKIVVPDWTEADLELYNKLPYYLAKMVVERQIKNGLLTPILRYEPNLGDVIRGIK